MTPRKKPGRPPILAPEIDEEETIHLNVTLYGREWNAIRAICVGAHLLPSQVLRVMINDYINRHSEGGETDSTPASEEPGK